MNRWTLTWSVGLVIGTAVLGSRVVSQEPPDAGWAPGDDEMERLMQLGTPGPEHRALEPLAGRWSQTVRQWMDPSAEPTVSTGTARYAWILGGRFLEGVYAGDMMGYAFEGRELLGFDRVRGEYVSVWVDNVSTSMTTARGTFDDATGSLLMGGSMDNGMTGQRDQRFRTVMKILADDEIVQRMYVEGPDGQEVKTLEISSRRMSSDAPAGR